MAMQSGIGVSKILVLAGAGYTTTVLLKNNKLSDLLGELQSLVKGLEKRGDQSEDSDYSDAVAAQVRRLAAEVRQLASARQITVLNGSDGYGNVSSLVVPAAALGALGYGYMWWKGLSFSDLMYVTKRSMANAVSDLKKNLENVTDAVAQTKKHLTQRIQNVADKVLEQYELSRTIKDDVAGVQKSVSQVGYDLSKLQTMLSSLDGKIYSLESKQDLANEGVFFLCHFVNGTKMKMPEGLQDQLELCGKSRGAIGYSDTPSSKGLKGIADSLIEDSKSASDIVARDSIDGWEDQRKNLLRSISTRC